jgi:hypothetical protein
MGICSLIPALNFSLEAKIKNTEKKRISPWPRFPLSLSPLHRCSHLQPSALLATSKDIHAFANVGIHLHPNNRGGKTTHKKDEYIHWLSERTQPGGL